MNRCKKTSKLRALREVVVSNELSKVEERDERGVLLLPTRAQVVDAHTVADGVVEAWKLEGHSH